MVKLLVIFFFEGTELRVGDADGILTQQSHAITIGNLIWQMTQHRIKNTTKRFWMSNI